MVKQHLRMIPEPNNPNSRPRPMRHYSFSPWLVAMLCTVAPLGAQAQPANARERTPARPLNLSLPRDVPGQVRMGPQTQERRLPLPAAAQLQDEPAALRGARELRYGAGYEARQSGLHGGAMSAGSPLSAGAPMPVGAAAAAGGGGRAGGR